MSKLFVPTRGTRAVTASVSGKRAGERKSTEMWARISEISYAKSAPSASQR